ncbi:MAG: hypothetical protein QGI21_01210 [Candidatus Poseidoniaceae archaeon]|jgi:hypothetical protein|nr:hypothetical protein [Candidatus Poseidoniaceae archaeon]
MYYVIKCINCERHSGSKGRAKKCPHCGSIFSDSEVVGTMDSAGDLQRAVALANMPTELRDEMARKMPRNIEVISKPSPGDLLLAIEDASIDGKLTTEMLSSSLLSRGIMIEVSYVIQEAISQGLLFDCGEENFVLLQ